MGNAALDAWNNAWLEGATATQKTMDCIPGKWDDMILSPIKNAMIWMDTVVEKENTDRRGNKKRKLDIINHKFFSGYMIIKPNGEIEKTKLEPRDPKKNVFFHISDTIPILCLEKLKNYCNVLNPNALFSTGIKEGEKEII